MPNSSPTTEKRWKVLVSAPCFLPVLEEYRSMLENRGVHIVATENPESLGEEDLIPLVSDIDGAICGDDRFTERVLGSAPKLKVISKWGTGIDSIDKAACEKRGIAVRRTSGAFTDAVSDLALGMILCFARTIPQTDALMKNGEWPKLEGRSLAESTVGLIGTGDIGRGLGKRVRACGARLLGYDIQSPPDAFLKETAITMTTLEDLLKQSDFVSLHLNLTEETRHLFSKPEFALMKNSAILINTARGPLVDEDALITALQNGDIAGAGLDVFEVEPLPQKSPLRTMSNVILSSHNANNTPGAKKNVHENTIRNLLEVLENESTLQKA